MSWKLDSWTETGRWICARAMAWRFWRTEAVTSEIIINPQPDIRIAIIRWSQLWKWTVHKNGLLIAFGAADTGSDGMSDAMSTYNKLKDNRLPVTMSYTRRSTCDARLLSPNLISTESDA